MIMEPFVRESESHLAGFSPLYPTPDQTPPSIPSFSREPARPPFSSTILFGLLNSYENVINLSSECLHSGRKSSTVLTILCLFLFRTIFRYVSLVRVKKNVGLRPY